MNKKTSKKKSYHYGTGRRKTSAARVFISAGKGTFTVNGKELKQYFPRLRSQIVAQQALAVAAVENNFNLLVTVRGGGESGQAEAIRHGVARALVNYDSEYKTPLRAAGLMSRDSRAVERKKTGLHKARRSKQFSKR